MKIKEFFQLIITRKLRFPIQTFHIFENKNRIRFFIGSLIIIICTAFYQTGTRAQLQPSFPAENKSAVLRTNESIQTSFVNKKENNLDPNASQNIPSIYPVTGRITDTFGSRANPFAGERREFHPGLDIAAPTGTSVNATADGMVALAGWQSGYGNIVVINHGGGIITRYGHLSQINISAGQTIKRGTRLGKVGSTGRSTGAHLHYEVRVDNRAVDPAGYLPPINR